MKMMTRKLGLLLLAFSFHFAFVACSGDDQQMQEEVQGEYDQQDEQYAQQQGGDGEENYQNENAGNQEEGDQQYADQEGNTEEGNYGDNYNPEQGNLEEGDYAQEQGEDGDYAQEGEEGEDLGEYGDIGNEAGDEDLQAILNDVNNESLAEQEEAVEDLTNQEAQPAEEQVATENIQSTEGYNAEVPAENATDLASETVPMENAAPVNNAGYNEYNAQPAPAPAAAPAIAGSLPEDGTQMPYVVVKGDTLGKIAQKIYGDMGRWKEIRDNSNLADANKIYPGDVVYYNLDGNSRAFAERYENAPTSVVTVAPGDTLHKIAANVYGSSSAWVLLWRHNGQIDNPDRLEVGTPVYYVMPESFASVKPLKSKTFAVVKKKLHKKAA